jgi:hypothetical protein
MQPISPLVRLILGAVAAGLATLAAPDVFGILPTWAQVLVGFLSAVLAFMLLPVNWQPNTEKTRAFKRGTQTRAKDTAAPRGGTGKTGTTFRGRMMIALAVILGAMAAASPAMAAPPDREAAGHYGCHNLLPYAEAWSSTIGPGTTQVYAWGGFYQPIGTNGAVVDCVIIGNAIYGQGSVCNPGVVPTVWADRCYTQAEARIRVVNDPNAPNGIGVVFADGYPQWKYLWFKMNEYRPEYRSGGCPNYGGYCIHGQFDYGF